MQLERNLSDDNRNTRVFNLVWYYESRIYRTLSQCSLNPFIVVHFAIAVDFNFFIHAKYTKSSW